MNIHKTRLYEMGQGLQLASAKNHLILASTLRGSQEQNGLENPTMSADFECHYYFCAPRVGAVK